MAGIGEDVMKVILLQDVKSLGKKGEIVTVSDGYAKNMLFPKKMAKEANAKNLNDLKLQKKNEDKMAAERLAQAKELAANLEGKKVVIAIRAGEGGRTFGSVSTKEISEETKKQLGLELDKKKMVLPEAIKALGTYEVPVKLHPEVQGILRVQVVEA